MRKEIMNIIDIVCRKLLGRLCDNCKIELRKKLLNKLIQHKN